MSAPGVVSVVVGPDEHGVVEHALHLAESTGSRVQRLPDAATMRRLAVDVAAAPVVHLHYTDRLYGPDTRSAAGAFCSLASGMTGRRLVVTLHDIPDPDGSDHSGRRAAAYRRVAARADLLIVASAAEHDRLRRCGIDSDCAVVPLPIASIAGRRSRHRRDEAAAVAIGVLGFIYPGKGHTDVIDAAARASGDVTVWAIGRASDGHDDVVAALRRQATAAACQLVITGFVDDDELADVLAIVDVPVMPARRPSASASLNRWIGAGRRPVVAANPYTREVAAVAPDLLTLYDADHPCGLDDAIAAAVSDPDSTWHDGEVPDRVTIAGVADAHRRIYEHLGVRR